MIKFLQINIGGCRAAQDLMYVTAAKMEVDFVLVSEQYRISSDEDRQFSDSGCKAAVIVMRDSLALDLIGPSTDNGFRWVETMGIRIYSCYWSPNSTINEFADYIDRLQSSVRTSSVPVIVAGDFNSHSPEWGNPDENQRGSLLADTIYSLNLYVCNRGNLPTYVRGASGTHIDVTFVSEVLIGEMHGWRVVDEESHSLHRYIWFELNRQRPNADVSNETRWSIFKLNTDKLQEAASRELQLRDDDRSSSPIEAKAKELICRLTCISDSCMPRTRGNPKRKPVPWWSESISTVRAVSQAA